jgi:phosphate:Na+ symporter
MNNGLFSILQILGSIAFFIFGMKMMSEGIQRAAGTQLRNILRTMTKNRFIGVLTGFFTTALVQSSSATTVMTVSFVNAGLVTLVESAGIMMGANIGTTMSAWIISLIGQIQLSYLSIPLFALGVPLVLMRRGVSKYWGEFIIGFGILFLSINFLQEAIPNIEDNPDLLSQLQYYADKGLLSRILFVFVGAVIAIVLQSSTAAMAITMILCVKGWLPLENGAAMVLGENIGTTITAEIASLVGNKAARRSARIHSFFNIIGVAWMVLLLPVFLPWISDFVDQFRGLFAGHLDTPENLSVLDENMYFILAAFHTIFNLLNVLLLIGFVQLLVKASIWSIPDDEEEEDKARLKFISTSNRTPELATNELMNATAHFGSVVSEMNIFSKDLLNSTDLKAINKLLDRIKKYEKIADRIEAEITEYISKLSDTEITQLTSNRLRNILNICHDLERTADLYYQISLLLLEKSEKRVYFLPYQRNNLNALFDLLNEALHVMKVNLSVPDYKTVDPQSAAAVETNINEMIIKIRSQILDGINQDGYNANSTIVYNDIFNLLEKIGDQIFSVTKSIIIDK